MTAAGAPVPQAPGRGAGVGPAHVAIIMDGNGRWAKRRFLPRIAGHRAGVEAVRKVVRAAPDLGIGVLTLYAFSSENWRRPSDEVSDLTGLLRQYLLSEIAELDANGVRLSFIGDYRRFGEDVARMIEAAAARTASNRRLRLVIALNYGAQNELARVARAMAQEAARGALDAAAIDEALIAARLDTADLPELDLLIRTSGEQRLSNFLLWQSAYSELYFTETLWPDFDAAALAAAVESFRARERRFGGV